MLFMPLENKRNQTFSFEEIVGAIKGASAHSINKALKRSGQVWQDESFDHVVRQQESLEAKLPYVRENPVRKGLVASPEYYPWLWEEHTAEGCSTPSRAKTGTRWGPRLCHIRIAPDYINSKIPHSSHQQCDAHLPQAQLSKRRRRPNKTCPHPYFRLLFAITMERDEIIAAIRRAAAPPGNWAKPPRAANSTASPASTITACRSNSAALTRPSAPPDSNPIPKAAKSPPKTCCATGDASKRRSDAAPPKPNTPVKANTAPRLSFTASARGKKSAARSSPALKDGMAANQAHPRPFSLLRKSSPPIHRTK